MDELSLLICDEPAYYIDCRVRARQMMIVAAVAIAVSVFVFGPIGLLVGIGAGLGYILRARATRAAGTLWASTTAACFHSARSISDARGTFATYLFLTRSFIVTGARRVAEAAVRQLERIRLCNVNLSVRLLPPPRACWRG